MEGVRGYEISREIQFTNHTVAAKEIPRLFLQGGGGGREEGGGCLVEKRTKCFVAKLIGYRETPHRDSYLNF